MNASADDNAAPRWLLPLVLAFHGALATAMLASPAPAVKPTLQAMQVALLVPPAAAPARPAEPPRPAVRRRAARRADAAVTAARPAPEPAAAAPQPAVAAAGEAAGPPAADPRPAAAAALVSPPRFDAAYLDNPRPPYPPIARRMGEEGRTVLRVLVSAAGLPERIELHESAGSPRLDEAAIAAVGRWRFVAARQGERMLAAWVLVPLVFKLEN